MAPTSTKATPKVQRSVTKTSKNRSSPEKRISNTKKRIEEIPHKIKLNNTIVKTRQRTNTVPKANTPKAKENKTASLPPGSVTKSAKKPAWKRRPQPKHSGVPVPEKMKALEFDDSLM